ncbi:MAG: GFA family protein [Rhodospirillales bacterium]
MSEQNHTGSCLCGAVAFEVNGPLTGVSFCHCSQCRKMTGHYLASTQAEAADMTFTEDRGLKWFRSSEGAERGFCAECGSTLFWRADGRADLSIAIGVIDGATGLGGGHHIFVADKGDYYELADDLPKFPVTSSG